MIDNSSATVMLGLEGMAVLAVSCGNGELEYAIETTQRSGWCPVCGAQARLHDRRPTWVRDLPAGGRSVTLVWIKRIWRCVHPECEQQTWTETHPGIAPRSSWTERARKQACRWVGRDGHSVAAVARDLGLGWATVMAAVVDHGSELIEREDRINDVHAMGVDETSHRQPGLVHAKDASSPTAADTTESFLWIASFAVQKPQRVSLARDEVSRGRSFAGILVPGSTAWYAGIGDRSTDG